MKLAFTSCMDASRVLDQPIWRKIQDEQPDVLMLLGDQIYMDWGLSRSNNPKWLKRIRKDKERGLQEFAQEMHARYAMQWGIASFRDLIRWFVPKRGSDQLFVCWDDHDFAWNNACGMGRADSARVPDAVKSISKALFEQFLDHLKKGYETDSYPAYAGNPLLVPTTMTKGIEYFAPEPIHSVNIAVFDQRWYRHPRDEVKDFGEFPTLLGSSQWHEIELMLAKSTGLNIIASGLPMRHKYFASHQSWSDGDGEPAYPDFDRMLRTVNKPTLYLCGDIHKNEVLGLIKDTKDHLNPYLFHVASSGAAIDNILIFKFEPSFGMLDIDDTAKTVEINLFKLEKQKWKIEDTHTLSYQNEKWEAPAPGILATQDNTTPKAATALAAMRAIETSEPDLALLCMRDLTKLGHKKTGPFGFENMDDVYCDDQFSQWPGSTNGAALPDAVTVSFSSQTIAIQKGNTPAANQHASDLMNDALARANKSASKALVLFVHGFNNDFVQNIEQALELRHMYGIEPVTLSWPAGEVRSLWWDGGSDAKLALAHAQMLASALACSLAALQAHKAQYPAVKCILLLRSFGSQALQEFVETDVWKSNSNAANLNNLHSIVLSAPAIEVDELNQWINKITIPVYAIGNRNDRALNMGYKWLVKDKALGAAAPVQEFKGKNYFFDCTGFDGVSDKHNIITEPGVTQQVIDLHASLLLGQFNTTYPPAGFAQVTGSNLWTKS